MSPCTSNCDESVLSLHNQGLTDDEIAETLSLSLESVKICLAGVSKDRRKAEREGHEDITDEELVRLFDAYKDLAFNSADEYMREKAIKWLICEKKGYNKTKNTIEKYGGNGINILVLNNSLKSLRDCSMPEISIVND